MGRSALNMTPRITCYRMPVRDGQLTINILDSWGYADNLEHYIDRVLSPFLTGKATDGFDMARDLSNEIAALIPGGDPVHAVVLVVPAVMVMTDQCASLEPVLDCCTRHSVRG